MRFNVHSLGPRWGVVVGVVVGVAMGLGCRPPVDTPSPVTADAAIDLERFVGDVPAVGPDWYDYDSLTHVLTPLDVSYVIRNGDGGNSRYAAVALRSYYDPASLDSGYFTFEQTVFGENNWGPTATIALTDNVKEAAICVDLFAAGDGMVDCASDLWQLMFRTTPRFLAAAGFVVREPGLFPRSVDGIQAAGNSTIATIDGNLDTLPDPRNIATLDGESAGEWHAPVFARDRFAAAVPLLGQLVGRRLVDGQGDLLQVFTGRRTLAELSWSVTGGAVLISSAATNFDLYTSQPGPWPESASVAVELNSDHQRVLLRLDEAGPVQQAAPATLTDMGDALSYDIELLLLDDGTPSLRLSPAAVAWNVTAADGTGPTP
jgi:hypothetical protein